MRSFYPPPPHPSLSLHQRSVLIYLKLVKATQKGEKLKQGRNITRNRTRVLAHQRPVPPALITIVIIILIIIIFVSLGFTIIIIIITSENLVLYTSSRQQSKIRQDP